MAVRSYVKGFREYEAATDKIRDFIQPLRICRPIIEFLENVDGTTIDARKLIVTSLDGGNYDNLDEGMIIEGNSLEDFLQNSPQIDLPGLNANSALADDLEEFFERFIEAAKAPAFTLSEYLLRARF